MLVFCCICIVYKSQRINTIFLLIYIFLYDLWNKYCTCSWKKKLSQALFWYWQTTYESTVHFMLLESFEHHPSGMKCFALQIPALLSRLQPDQPFAHPVSVSLSTTKHKPSPPAPVASSRPSNIYAVAGLPHSPRGQEGSGAGVADCRAWAHAKRWWMA